MEGLEKLLLEVEGLEFTGNQKCIEMLDNRLQDIIKELTQTGYKANGELIDLKACSWVLHERYHMDTDDNLKWTFNHTKHRIVKNCGLLVDAGLKTRQ